MRESIGGMLVSMSHDSWADLLVKDSTVVEGSDLCCSWSDTALCEETVLVLLYMLHTVRAKDFHARTHKKSLCHFC